LVAYGLFEPDRLLGLDKGFLPTYYIHIDTTISNMDIVLLGSGMLPGTLFIRFGLILPGKGQVWLANPRLEVLEQDEKSVPV